MAQLAILTASHDAVLPALDLLSHRVVTHPPDTAHLASLPHADAYVIDGRGDLAATRALCRLVRATAPDTAMLLVITEGGLTVVTSEWGIDDILLPHAGPAEVDARIRLALSRAGAAAHAPVESAGLTIDEDSYSARLNGKALDLTFREFQLLHFLVTHPSRAFTREQLLSEVWGYDYFGGARTVDVHIRRLRAKLGDTEHLIGTVRNVGYRFLDGRDDDSGA